MAKLLPTNYAGHLARSLKKEITSSDNTAFYVYTGVHGDVIGDIPTPADDVHDLVVNAYRNMIFGKRVTEDDVAMLIRNIPYVADTVYAMYDDNDPDIFAKDFYVQVNEGAYYHVYKCLNNNFGADSTVEPSFAWVNEQSNYTFETSDGYVWKYMYTVTAREYRVFSTENYFPVMANSAIQNNAINGALDVIRIEQTDLDIPGGGRKYDNYVSGTFSTNQLRVTGNNHLYGISNNSINHSTGFYTGCMIYLSGGVGAGQYAKVTDFFIDDDDNYIVIDSPFDIPPQNGTTFEIYPDVLITGSGTQTVNAVARALVNATGSNSIYKIEILERGANYDYLAARVVANSAVTGDIGFVEAELHPIYSPARGHGYWPSQELGSDAVNFAVELAGDDEGLLATNRFQQIGLISSPRFSNVGIQMANTSGIFHQYENIYKIDPLRINANVTISNTASDIRGETMTLSSASIVSGGDTGDYVPQDILTIEGGTAIVPAQVKVLTTTVLGVTINAIGSGYTPGVFTANLNLGTATTNAQFQVTANSLGQCQSIIITNPGVFSTNPPFLANSTPVGGSPGSGLTVDLRMGLNTMQIHDTGAYALIPTDLATNEPLSNIGSGAGAELLIDFTATLTADFLNQLEPGDFVYITNPEGTLQHFATVDTVTNSSYLTITTNGSFSCTIAHMYLPRATTEAIVSEVSNSTTILLSNVSGELFTSDLLVGETSSAKAQVNSVMRNGEAKNLSSFIQLYKYNIDVLSGDFIENEIIYQGDSFEGATATALVHSIATGVDTLLYTSNQVGQFTTNTNIQGVSSLAVASISRAYSPELEFGSGKLLYIENHDPVNRDVDKTETLQIVLGF